MGSARGRPGDDFPASGSSSKQPVPRSLVFGVFGGPQFGSTEANEGNEDFFRSPFLCLLFDCSGVIA